LGHDERTLDEEDLATQTPFANNCGDGEQDTDNDAFIRIDDGSG